MPRFIVLCFCLIVRLGTISQSEWMESIMLDDPSTTSFVQIDIEIFLLAADNNILSYLCRSKYRHTNCHSK